MTVKRTSWPKRWSMRTWRIKGSLYFLPPLPQNIRAMPPATAQDMIASVLGERGPETRRGNDVESPAQSRDWGVTCNSTFLPSRITTTVTGWPIFNASMA